MLLLVICMWSGEHGGTVITICHPLLCIVMVYIFGFGFYVALLVVLKVQE